MKNINYTGLFIKLALLVGFYFSSISNLYSQISITEKFENRPLVEVLEQLTQKYNIKLAYDNNLIKPHVVSGSFKNENLEEFLKTILIPNNLEFIKLNDVYIIRAITITAHQEPIKQIKYKVLGVVKEKGTGETLPYASVVIQGVQTGTSSNTDGYFSLLSNKSDSLILKISYIGFEPIELKVAPQSIGKDVMIFELERNNTIIKDAAIVKNIQEQIQTSEEPGLIQLNSSKNSTLTTISSIDIAAPLQMLPGIDGTTESLSGLMVRHSQSDKNLFIYDGFTIYHMDHFFGAFSSFNSKAIKDIRVIRGGFDSHWGGRASSVVEITGKTGNENHLMADVGFDLLGADLEIDGPIGKKVSFVVAARRSFTDRYRSDLYFNLFESARSDLSTSKSTPSAFKFDSNDPSFYYYDINTKLSVKPTAKDIISLSSYKGYDQLSYLKSDANPFITENSNWGNNGVGLRWSRQWNERFYHLFTAGYSKYNLYYNHKDSSLRRNQWGVVTNIIRKKILIDNSLEDANLNLQGDLKYGRASSFEFGLAANRVDIGVVESNSQYYNSTRIIDTLKIINNISSTLTFWAQNTISIDALKTLKFGGRMTYHDLTNKYYFEPRLQLVLQPSELFSLKFAAGLYDQFVNRVVTIENGTYRNAWTISDGLKFPVVKSKHFVGGFNIRDGNGFSLDIEGYHKNTSGISYVQTILTRTGSGASTQIKQEKRVYTLDSRVTGVDVLLKKSWEQGQVWVAYTLSKSINQSDVINGGQNYPALDDQLHEFKFVNIINLKRWSFNLSWIYGSGKPWDEILLTQNYLISPDYEKNSERLEPYHRLDAGVSYTIKVLNGEIQTGAKFFNLYNHINTLAKPYTLSENLLQDIQQGNSIITYTENQGMGFTPTFFLNVKF